MVKTTSVLRGTRDIRTMTGATKGSIPRMRESPYLRLHMLWTDNARLSREYASAEKRRLSLERRMKENRAESARLAPQSLPARQQAGGAEASSAALTTPRRPRRTKMSTRPVRH